MRSKAFIENRLTEKDGGTLYEYRNEFKAPFGPLGSTAEHVVAGGVPEREARRLAAEPQAARREPRPRLERRGGRQATAA